MTIRKRRQPTPDFKIPPPYEPITGQRAPLMAKGDSPYCAMMQVAAEDTRADYVICRGYDTRIQKFIDYEEGNSAKPGIAVAKPYGSRVKNHYKVGEVHPAFLPLFRIGQNPGYVANRDDAFQGHPDNLGVEVSLFADENGTYINWMMIGGYGSSSAIGRTSTAIAGRFGTIPGWGMVLLLELNGGFLNETDEEILAYNLSDAVVPADTYVELLRIGDAWWVIYEGTETSALIGKTDVYIPGRVGSVPGSGLVSVHELVAGVLLDTDTNVTAWNIDVEEVAIYTYVQLIQVSGLWWIIPLDGAVPGSLIGMTYGSVSGRVSDTPGVGIVEIHRLAGRVLVETGEYVNVFNLSTDVIPDETYVTLVWALGAWWAIPTIASDLVGIARTDSLISGRTVVDGKHTPGSGSITLYDCHGDTLTSTGISVTAYSLDEDDIDRYEYVEVIFVSGKWWIIAPRDGKVKVDSTDPLDYLEDQFEDKTTYAYAKNTDGHEILVDKILSTDDNTQKLQLYLPFDLIQGYDSTQMQVLIHTSLAADGEKLQWVTIVEDEFVTDLQAGSAELQMKTRNVYSIKMDAESVWTTWAEGTEC